MNLMTYHSRLNDVGDLYFFNIENGLSIDRTASIIALATNIPIIVVYYFIMWHVGTSEFLENRIKSLQEFYRLDIIEGIDEIFKTDFGN